MSVSRGREDSAALSGREGGYAPLDSGLLVPRAYLPQISGLLHKMDATTAPTVNDDSGDGYGIGSRWLDITNDMEYICTDASVGSATWLLSASKYSSYTPTWNSSGTPPAIVNGTITGNYLILAPGLIWVYINMVLGSSSTVGTGSYSWSLPSVVTTIGGLISGGTGHYRDSSSTQRAVGVVTGAASNRIVVKQTNVAINAADWSATLPVNPPASGDSYDIMAILQYT